MKAHFTCNSSCLRQVGSACLFIWYLQACCASGTRGRAVGPPMVYKVVVYVFWPANLLADRWPLRFNHTRIKLNLIRPAGRNKTLPAAGFPRRGNPRRVRQREAAGAEAGRCRCAAAPAPLRTARARRLRPEGPVERCEGETSPSRSRGTSPVFGVCRF